MDLWHFLSLTTLPAAGGMVIFYLALRFYDQCKSSGDDMLDNNIYIYESKKDRN